MAALDTIPTVVHDLAGRPVALSEQARRTLAALIESDAAYIYVPVGIDRQFYNVWLNHEVDPQSPMGYRGVRIPLADWARQQQQQEAS